MFKNIAVLASETWQPRSQVNQKPLVVTDKVGRPRMSLEWASPWNVIYFLSYTL